MYNKKNKTQNKLECDFMNLPLYIFIFLSKIIEIAIGTLRVIMIAGGKKILGAILQLVIALIWVLSTGAVVVNITKDPFKILFFCLGSLVGSYLGSFIEEKIALGSNMITCITDKKNHLTDYIRDQGYAVTSVSGKGKDTEKEILFIMIKRKEVYKMTRLLQRKDHHSMIISEVATTICGGYKDS